LNAVEIKDLHFGYKNEEGSHSFNLNIPEWNISKGDFISLLGPNGCGKSTLLKLIGRLIDLKSGSVLVDGKNISEYRRKDLAKKIAYVPQKNISIFPFSVYEIVTMGRTPYLNLMGFENAADRELVDDALQIMQIEKIKNKGINEISGGEAQRVFIARALAQKAEIILLDEPNAHLDLEHQVMIFELLKKLNEEEKITVLAVSHDLNLVGIFSKKITMMNEGSIALHGEKQTILTRENIRKIFKIDSALFPAADLKSINVLINPNPIINGSPN